jgi:hypothetical protein
MSDDQMLRILTRDSARLLHEVQPVSQERVQRILVQLHTRDRGQRIRIKLASSMLKFNAQAQVQLNLKAAELQTFLDQEEAESHMLEGDKRRHGHDGGQGG